MNTAALETSVAANRQLLRSLARKYIWWKTPETALQYPRRVIAQVMNLGTWKDVRTLEAAIDPDLLRAIIEHAEAGWFSDDSWHYWHYRLGMVPPSAAVPQLPRRTLE
ncbi:MAG: hypothetical protein ACHQAR_04350 [Steroidobacterales bacterium]